MALLLLLMMLRSLPLVERAPAHPPILITSPKPQQEYVCRRCGAAYTSLDAIRLLDPLTGAFHCEDCKAELDANIAAAGLGASPQLGGQLCQRCRLVSWFAAAAWLA